MCLHYVTITGYNRDKDGNVSDVVIANSKGATRDPMPIAELKEKWANLQMKNVSTGLNNVMIVAVPRGNAPILGGDGVARPASSLRLPTPTMGAQLRSSGARVVAGLASDGAQAAEAVRDGAVWAGRTARDGAVWVGRTARDGAVAVGGAVQSG